MSRTTWLDVGTNSRFGWTDKSLGCGVITGATNAGALSGAPTVATYGRTAIGFGTNGALAAVGNTALGLRGAAEVADGFACWTAGFSFEPVTAAEGFLAVDGWHALFTDCENAVTTASDTVNVASARRIMGLPLAGLAGLAHLGVRPGAPLASAKWTTRGCRDAVLRSRTGRRLCLHIQDPVCGGRFRHNSSRRSPASNRSTWL